MIFILWITLCLLLIAAGAAILQPWWVMKLVNKKFYCERCHEDITRLQRFAAEQTIRESLEGRQV